MKVDITREEKKAGLVFKKTYYVVNLTVQLTDQEKKVIEINNIKDHIVCERPIRAGVSKNNDPDFFHLRVLHLLKGKTDSYEFETLGAANEYQNALVPSLKNLKSFIEQNGAAPENTSIEL